MRADSTYVPYENGSLSSGKTSPGPVIASFDTKGEIRPLYVRIHGRAFKIESCTETRAGTVSRFECKYVNYGIQLSFVCLYFRSTGEWKLELS